MLLLLHCYAQYLHFELTPKTLLNPNSDSDDKISKINALAVSLRISKDPIKPPVDWQTPQ